MLAQTLSLKNSEKTKKIQEIRQSKRKSLKPKISAIPAIKTPFPKTPLRELPLTPQNTENPATKTMKTTSSPLKKSLNSGKIN